MTPSRSPAQRKDDEAELARELAGFGLAIEEQTPEPDPVCEVWPEHWDACQLWLACQGQLRLVAGMGGALWLAAPASEVAQEARWIGLRGQRQAQVVQQYRVIEAEALLILNTSKE